MCVETKFKGMGKKVRCIQRYLQISCGKFMYERSAHRIYEVHNRGSFETLRLIVKSNFWNIWQKSRPRKITLQYIVKSSKYNAANTDSLRSHNAVGIYDSRLGHSHNLIAVSATHTLTQDARIPMHESKLSFSNCWDCSSSPAGVSLLKNSPQRTNDFIGGL